MSDLLRDFDSRDDLIAYCREQFPDAVDVDDSVIDTELEPRARGGRAAAEEALADIEPVAYGRTRNRFDGAVTRLSAYLRHGVLGLAEVRDHVLATAGKSAGHKLINELAWRDYFQRCLREHGDDVRASLEDWKTGLDPADYADALPDDIRDGHTGVAFIDAMVAELRETGYLHNQARMKVAAYVVHFRRVHWSAGADWFLSHLLDGDLGSNHLSWQWVASTFSSKPYIFNQANLDKWTDGRFHQSDSPFNGSYDQLNERLFP